MRKASVQVCRGARGNDLPWEKMTFDISVALLLFALVSSTLNTPSAALATVVFSGLNLGLFVFVPLVTRSAYNKVRR